MWVGCCDCGPVWPSALGGPVLDEVGEAEVGAGAGAAKAHGEAEALGGSGAIGGEAGDVGGGDDAAVLHVADEDLGAVRAGW